MPTYDLNDYDALAAWLEPRRYVILTSLRKDGSPLSTPVAFYYADGHIHFTMQTVRMGVRRVRRDARVAIAAVDNADGQPPTDFRVHGLAEEIEDPGHAISRKVASRAVEGRPGYDFPAFLENWLSHGRVVFRVPVNDETCRFKDGAAMVRAVAEGRATYEKDGAGAGGADGKTLFMEQERQRRAAEARARREGG